MDKNKNKRDMEELSSELERDAVNNLQQAAAQTQNQPRNWQTTTNQYEKLLSMINKMAEDTRQQRMQSEQTIQSSINQAVTALNDVQTLEQIYKACQQMQQNSSQGAMAVQNNISQFRQIINSLQAKAHQQLTQFDNSTIQSLQQAISSMAQAQASMLQSQAACKIFQTATQFEEFIEQIGTPSSPQQPVIH